MNHLRKLSIFICSCLILNCVPMNAQAQVSNEKATGEVVNAWISVTAMAFPEAAVALEAGKKLLDMLDVFGKPDATGEALKKINERLDRIEKRITDVDNKVKALRNDFFTEKNYTRVQLLRTKRELLQGLVLQLKSPTDDKLLKRDLARAVGSIANDFLDPELWKWSDWQWSDMQHNDGKMVDPDFKPLPTLELYATTLATWMTAIANTGDDSAFIKQTYGPGLQRHITYLMAPKSIRASKGDTLAKIAAAYAVTTSELGRLNNITDPNQQLQPGYELSLPNSLAEDLRARIFGSIDSIDKWPRNRICTYEVYLTNNISHAGKDLGPGQVQVPSNNDMCQVPAAMGHVAEEDRVQRVYGLDVMEALAAKLDRLRVRGTLAEQYIGEFDKTAFQQDFLYAVSSNGELLWYRHLVATKPKATPPDMRRVATPAESSDMRKVNTEGGSRVGTTTSSTGRVGTLGSMRDQSPASGVTNRRLLDTPTGAATAAADAAARAEVIHRLDGPKRIGTGWGQFRDVLPAGKDSIYAVSQDGTLNWYRHDNLWDDVGSPQWKGPINVGSGWQSFVRIVPAGDGVLYAIDSSGTLKWYKHSGYLDGSVTWSGPIDIYPGQRSRLTNTRFGPNWATFKQVFSGGEGIMYTITSDGVLQWYHHRGYLTGTPEWDGPRNVGTGWQDFARVFSTGDGVIYAMKPTGEMVWYKHVGYKDGTVSWQGPVEIAADWKDFIFVFPRMTGTWTPPVIH